MAKPFVPPRFFIVIAWKVHRAIARRGPGRGLWRPGERNAWGALKLTTTGRQSGRSREAILGYLEDDDAVHVVSMNGWGEGVPAWHLNVRAQPRVTVTMPDGSTHAAIGHTARGEERDRLWADWLRIEPELGALAARRDTPTEIIVFVRD